MRVFPHLCSACALLLAVLYGAVATVSAWSQPGRNDTFQQSASVGTDGTPGSNPEKWFAQGQAALKDGNLDAAEAAFRRVLAADPGSGAAYSNLGVIAMRRKQWGRAIQLLRKAQTLDPKLAGIRLNIGLAEYQRGDYAAAIAPLASVLREEPGSEQARRLLGLCEVLSKRYADAVKVLQPLWAEKSDDVPYLYLLDIAAVESGQKELDEKILKQMIAVGGKTAEYHLIQPIRSARSAGGTGTSGSDQFRLAVLTSGSGYYVYAPWPE